VTTIPDEYWEQRDASKKNPGLYTNQIYVQHLGEGLLRLSFGEVLDDEPRYHSALVLTAHNAYAFGELMMRMAQAAAAAETEALDKTNEEATREASNESPDGR
jgi:hypothetical protein